MNMLTLSAIRADGEYRQLKDDLSRAFVGKTLPFAASGLCEGAANAAVLALLQDLRGKYRGAAKVGHIGMYRDPETHQANL